MTRVIRLNDVTLDAVYAEGLFILRVRQGETVVEVPLRAIQNAFEAEKKKVGVR